MTLHSRTAIPWIMAVGAVLAAAQSPALGRENLGITPSARAQPEILAASSVTVIPEGAIRRMGGVTVLDLLRWVSGSDVIQRGGPGQEGSVLLRGGEAEHTLVFVDGILLNSPATGTFDFSGLTVEAIERIEIIRGSQSPLYGSDAIGGVIRIFTRKGTATGAALSVEGGSLGTSRESAAAQVKQSDYDLSLSASRWDTDGISVRSDGSEKDGYQNTSLSVRLGKDLPSRRVDLTGRFTNGTTDLDLCKFDLTTFTPYDCDNPAAEQERRLALVGFRVQSQPNSIWEQLFSANVTAERLTNRDPDPNGLNSRIDTEIRTAEWQNNLTPSPSTHLTVGYEWKEEKGESPGSFDRSITNHGVYLQDHRGIGTPLELLAGVRWDGNSRYEDAWTYRVLTAVTTPGGVRGHIQYGTGFHGPDLNDLYWPDDISIDPYAKGNPDLKPEKSRSWEAGLQRASGPVTLRVVYFNNRFSNLIQWGLDPSDPFFRFMPNNVARTESSGWEGEWLYQPAAGFRMGAQYTYDDAKDLDTGEYLLRRPLNKYSVNMEMGSPDKNLGIRLLHVGRRVDINESFSRIYLGAYNRVDLYAAYRMTERFEAFVRIENLLDKAYEEVSRTGVAGVSSYGGVRLTF